MTQAKQDLTVVVTKYLICSLADANGIQMAEEDVVLLEEGEREQRDGRGGRGTVRMKWYHRYLARMSDDNINAFSGALAGVGSGVAVCPLDVAKTRLQAQGGFGALLKSQDPTSSKVLNIAKKYSGILGTIRVIFKDEGVRGLYRGVVPIVIGYIPTWTVYFLLYEKSKSLMSSSNPHLTHICSALIAGGTSTLVTNPIWVVKTRLMSQNSNSAWYYRGTVDAFRTMYKQEGLGVFYSGLGPALLGLTHVAVQFPLYERFKQSFTSHGRSELTDNLGILLSSGLSKVIASSITYPHEVVRTRNQIQPKSSGKLKYRGILTTVRTIYLEEGWRAFYAGLGTNMFRAVPSSAVTLFTYELVSRHLKQCRDDTRNNLLLY